MAVMTESMPCPALPALCSLPFFPLLLAQSHKHLPLPLPNAGLLLWEGATCPTSSLLPWMLFQGTVRE